MRILITGGAGFIGSYLAEKHVAEGDQVTVADDLSTGRRENLAAIPEGSRFELRVGSVLDPDFLAPLIDGADLVYHLAAAVGVRLIVESPAHTLKTNVRGTEVVLDLAARRKVPVVIASTSEVYGKRERMPFREDDDLVLGPTMTARWGYACSKAVDEFLAFAYWREYQVPIVIARLFNTVGPRQVGRYGMVIPTLVRQALRGEPLTVYGDGTQSRCFADVLEVVDALVALGRHPDARGNVFNIGGSEEITIRALAEKIRALTGAASPIVLVPYDDAYEEGFEDVRRRVPDTEKLRRLTGLKSAHKLDAVLQRIIDYERQQLADEAAGRVPADVQ